MSEVTLSGVPGVLDRGEGAVELRNFQNAVVHLPYDFPEVASAWNGEDVDARCPVDVFDDQLDPDLRVVGPALVLGVEVVLGEDREEWMPYMERLPESEVKERFATILAAGPTKSDWGGELHDLVADVVMSGRQGRAAFLLKGPTRFAEMTPKMLGANADQIYRLAQSAADVLVVQHCHRIDDAVRETLRAFAVTPHRPRRYCLIDGQQTYKILKAYEML